MRRETFTLLILAGITAIAVGIALAGEAAPALLRVLFGLPLALFLPGYALLLALFKHVFVPSARLMLSLGLSLIIMVLGAFLLHFTPAGLRAESWAVLLGSITWVGCLVAHIRQINPDAYEGSVEVEAVMTAPLRRPSLPQVALFAVAGFVVVAAIIIASIGAQYPQSELVNLWIKRSEVSSDTGRIQIGVDNVNSSTEAYRVKVQRGEFVVREWPELEIAPGITWIGTIELTANPPGHGTLEALLYRADNPQQIFRRVSLSIEK
jgi:uncharacterized membrane protein